MNRPVKSISETPRLILREFELYDANSMWELNSDPEVIKYTGDPPFASIEKAREFLLNYEDYEKKWLRQMGCHYKNL